MVHGFTGSPASMRPIGRWLAERGLSVVGIRLPGHGTSVEDLATTAWTDWVAEADVNLTTLRARCRTVGIFAQSMGAAIAIHLAATRPADVGGLVLASPYVHDPRLALAPLVRRFSRSVKGVANDIKKPGQNEVAYDRMPVAAVASMRELLRIADRDLPGVRAPLVVFRSGQDHVIPNGNPERVTERAGSAQKELVRCPDSYHVVTLDNDAPMVAERALGLFLSL